MINPHNEIKFALNNALTLLKSENKPLKAAQYIENVLSNTDRNNRPLLHWLGLTLLEAGKYSKASDTFLSFDEYYQAGYCELLQGNLDRAKELWRRLKISEVKQWSQALETLVEGAIIYEPSFLNLRNHLEMDLGYFLRANQIQYVDNILSIIHDLANINLECYKFAGRALLHNNYENQSVTLLLEGQKALPTDPEIYYHLGQYTLQAGAVKDAISMFNHCLLLSPSYTPARDRLNEIKARKR